MVILRFVTTGCCNIEQGLSTSARAARKMSMSRIDACQMARWFMPRAKLALALFAVLRFVKVGEARVGVEVLLV